MIVSIEINHVKRFGLSNFEAKWKMRAQGRPVTSHFPI